MAEASRRQRLTGHIRVALPPDQAFRLFTPRGEEEWATGWKPRFPVPAPDDTRPGTVFETDAHGQRTVWLVVDRSEGRRISYARVTPGERAGTVTVVIDAVGQHGEESDVEVTYDLTALSDATDGDLADFADGYAAYLRSWQNAIAARLRAEPSPHRHPSHHDGRWPAQTSR
ncbi:MAG TPA: SRPBCC family protein [Streptosporangiaceae bacterium]|nr:SRPBCC family protein [Streptosporangiaceae bacterium]